MQHKERNNPLTTGRMTDPKGLSYDQRLDRLTLQTLAVWRHQEDFDIFCSRIGVPSTFSLSLGRFLDSVVNPKRSFHHRASTYVCHLYGPHKWNKLPSFIVYACST